MLDAIEQDKSLTPDMRQHCLVQFVNRQSHSDVGENNIIRIKIIILVLFVFG